MAGFEDYSSEARAAIRELWFRGDLSYKLRPEQVAFKHELDLNRVQLFVANICRRWGKSFTLVTFAIEQCLKNKKIRVRYGAAFRTDLEEFILPAFELILEDCPPELRPTFIASKQTWVFPNGATIKLVGLDKNPNGLRGNAIAIIIIDEAGFVVKLRTLYTTVIIPATAKQKGIRIIFASTPPESPDHYFVTLIDKAKARGFYVEHTIDEISDMPAEEKQRLIDETGEGEGLESIAVQREYYCKIIVDETRAICATFIERIHVEILNRPEHARFILSGDVGGVRDLTVFHILTFDWHTQKVWFLEERYFQAKTASGIWVPKVKEMEAPYIEPGKSMARWVDAPGQLQIDLSVDYQFPCSLPAKEDFGATIHYLRNQFLKDAVRVHERCVLLRKTLAGGLLNAQRTDHLRTETLGHNDAAMSAVYGLRHVDRTTNPIPRPKNEIIFNPNPPQQRQLEILKKLSMR